MNPRVKEVVPNKDFTITITFINGEIGIYELKTSVGHEQKIGES